MKFIEMKKNFYFYYLLPILILGIGGCGIYTSVYSSYDKTVDFSQYKTFALLPDSGVTARRDSFRNSAFDNDVIRNNAKNYIIHELNVRGLRLEVDNPDVLVQLVLLNEKKQLIITYPPFSYSPYYFSNRWYYPYYYPYYDYYTYYGWGCNYYYCGYTPPYQQTYVKGTIRVNMFDRRMKKLVWTGSAEGDIYDPAFIQKDIHPAIQKIMKKFPVRVTPKEERNNIYSVKR